MLFRLNSSMAPFVLERPQAPRLAALRKRCRWLAIVHTKNKLGQLESSNCQQCLVKQFGSGSIGEGGPVAAAGVGDTFVTTDRKTYSE
jgi:hypothetical protein